MADLDSVIGAKISLISEMGIRYTGVLFSINAAESSIVLRDVLCMGTENRVVEKTVAPREDVIAFISFPGGEIKDLYVHENDDDGISAPAPPATAPENQPVPPKPPRAHDKPKQQSGNRGHGAGGGRNSQNNDRNHGENKPSRVSASDGKPRNTSTPGMGNHLLHAKGRPSDSSSSTPANMQKTDFDFQAALTNFNKVAIKEEVAATEKPEAEGTATTTSKYVKDDFFDCLTSEKQTRPSYQEERALNQDTFGATSVPGSHYRRYGGRGGRGRGRGRGGGRGRGYYNKSGSYNNSS